MHLSSRWHLSTRDPRGLIISYHLEDTRSGNLRLNYYNNAETNLLIEVHICIANDITVATCAMPVLPSNGAIVII